MPDCTHPSVVRVIDRLGPMTNAGARVLASHYECESCRAEITTPKEKETSMPEAPADQSREDGFDVDLSLRTGGVLDVAPEQHRVIDDPDAIAITVRIRPEAKKAPARDQLHLDVLAAGLEPNKEYFVELFEMIAEGIRNAPHLADFEAEQ